MKHKDVCSIYNDIAAWFDSARDKSFVEREHFDFIQARLPDNAHILDLGCGTSEPVAKFSLNPGCALPAWTGRKI